ncbi:MAG: hypothetical protein ACRENE_04330 [Polyangiaceae bacterium]
MRVLATALAQPFLLLALGVSGASAQSAAPAQAAPQPAQEAPWVDTRHWREGDPVPPGYHVEDLPRSGLVKAGYIVTGIPYFFSVVTVLAANDSNESGWLLVPFAGPWLTMGRRNYGCDADSMHQTTGNTLSCVADIFVVMGLIFDGVVQATGGALLLSGYVATKPGLVRNDATLHFSPLRIGSGTGVGVFGEF